MKNKTKNAAKNRQKKALKATRRRKANRGKKRAKPQERPEFELPESAFPQEDYVYWLAHGANYLSSDYSEGNWTPLFPELYTGRLYEPEDLIKKTLAHFESQGDPRNIQKRVLAWLLTDRTLIWAFRAGMATKVINTFPDDDPVEMLRRPHVGVLWDGFSHVFDSTQGDSNEETDAADDVVPDGQPESSEAGGEPTG